MMYKQNKWMIIISIVVSAFFFTFVGLVVSYITANYMIGATNSEKEIVSDSSKEKDTNVPDDTIGKTNEKIYNIGITETNFRQKFNNVTSEELSSLNLRLTRNYVYNGAYANVYQVPFDNTTSLAVSFEPNSELIRGVFLSGMPTTSAEKDLFLGVIIGILGTLNPDLPPAGRRRLLQELGMFDGKHTMYQPANKSTYRNNVHYSFQKFVNGGLMFLAVAKDLSLETGAAVSREEPHNIMADLTNFVIWDYENQNKLMKEFDLKSKKELNTLENNTLEMSLGGVSIGDTKNDVYSKLGRELKITYQGDFSYPRYQYPNMEVIIFRDVVTAFVSKNNRFKTARGIGEGDSIQTVLAVYGHPDMNMEYDGYTLYEYKFISKNGKNCLLRFAFKNNVVSYISGRSVD